MRFHWQPMLSHMALSAVLAETFRTAMLTGSVTEGLTVTPTPIAAATALNASNAATPFRSTVTFSAVGSCASAARSA